MCEQFPISIPGITDHKEHLVKPSVSMNSSQVHAEFLDHKLCFVLHVLSLSG